MFMKLQNKNGSIFIITLLLTLVLLILGSAFVVLMMNEGKVAERQRRTYIAFNIAEAGIERALYDLRQDFINGLKSNGAGGCMTSSSPSWSDGCMSTYPIGPDTTNFYTIPYASTSLNGGSYTVKLKNVSGATDAVWVQSTGTFGDTTQKIQVYAKIFNISPWNNAIFAGVGSAAGLVNGNVDINGSVHILGNGLSSTDYAVDLGGTAELIGNNYNGLSSSLLAKIPALPTTTFNGETVSTLNAVLRVKRGLVGLSGAASVGDVNVAGNSVKETIDAVYSNDGFGGSAGTANVHSDNGWSNAYDLGNSVIFPSLSDPFPGYSTYQAYLKANALVINNASQLATLASITPNSNFNFTDSLNGKGSIKMDGNGNLTISGIVYIDGGDLNMNKAGSNKTINYTGTGSVFVSGNAQINLNLLTSGNNSFPNNILGIMTPKKISFNAANISVMGLFYAEGQTGQVDEGIEVEKQTVIVGTLVSNYFDMTKNVPEIYQVPSTVTHLPPGMIGQTSSWSMKVVSWQKL